MRAFLCAIDEMVWYSIENGYDRPTTSQKSSHDKTSLGYTDEGSSSSELKKEVRFILAKNIEKLKGVKPKIETPIVVNRTVGANQRKKGSHYQKSKGTSSEAFLSSLWHARAHKAKLLQASCTQEG